MATTRKELKEQARDQLRGNWGWAVLLSFVGWLIVYILTDIENFFLKRAKISCTVLSAASVTMLN